MATMQQRTLEVNLISAQDLKHVKNFGQQANYAVVYIYESDKKSTKVDNDGGLNPTWNSKISLTCDDALLQKAGSYLTVEIYSHGSFSNKIVGTVQIALVDIGKEAKGAEPKFMAYEVHRPSGKVKGVLQLTVKLGETKTVKVPQLQNNGKLPFSAYSGAYGNQQQWQGGGPMGYQQAYAATSSSAKPYGTGAATASSVYPPPKVSSSSGAKADEPVMAYPASGMPGAYPPQGYGQQYGQQYGPQYGGSQQYYPSPQASDPYNYQQAYYGRPSRRQGGMGMGSGMGSGMGRMGGMGGGGGMGMGLLGGALGGLLLGDIIGSDMGGGGFF